MTTPTCTFVQGDVQSLTRETSATSAITAGDILTDGNLTLVAHANIAAGDPSELAFDGGIYDVVKDPSVDFTLGDRVHVDFSTGLAVAAPTANSKSFGICARTTPALATSVRCTHAQAAGYATTDAGSMTASDITGSDASLAITGLGAAQGGAVPITGGTSSTAGNAGGAVSLTGGTPGATGVGGASTVAGGPGGSTSGTGGAALLEGGDGTAGNADGGSATVRGGNANGSGTDGAVSIGETNTSAVNIGAASIPTTITGPGNRPAGASTAAAGTTTADAGVLPAGTAGVYPTTAADDTKGVRVHASDKVTSRMIFIGNGVSNKILKVYAPSGGTINGAAADAAFSSASGKGVVMYCLDATANTWLAW